MPIYTWVENVEKSDHTGRVELRGGALVLQRGKAADLTESEIALLRARGLVLAPGGDPVAASEIGSLYGDMTSADEGDVITFTAGALRMRPPTKNKVTTWAPHTEVFAGAPLIAPNGQLVAALRDLNTGAVYRPADFVPVAASSTAARAVRQALPRSLDDVFQAALALPGVILAHALRETSGTVAHDAAGISDGVITGPMVLGADGPMGGKGMMNPASGGAAYVNVPHVTAMSWADTFTYLVILRRKNTHSGAAYGVLSKGTGNVALAIVNDKLRLRKNGGSDVFLSSEGITDVYRDHLIIARKNGATVSIRMDGVELTKASGVDQTGTATTNDWQVGDAATATGTMALAGHFTSSSYWTDAQCAAIEALWTGKPAPVEFTAKLGTHGERQSGSSDPAVRAAINTKVRALHGKIVRSTALISTIWAGVAPDWTRHDDAFGEVEDADLENLLVLSMSPQWMNGSADRTVVPGAGSATDAAFLAWRIEWLEKAEEVVRRYMPGGAAGTNVRLWELWNEPNLAASWKSATAPSAAQYAALWDGVQDVFAAIDPAYNTPAGTLRLAFGALASPRATGGSDIAGMTFLASCVTAGATFEILSLHAYDTGTGIVRDPGINSGETTGKANDFGDIRVVRDYLQQIGRSHVRLWVTEFGWSTAGATQVEIATFLAKALRIARDYFSGFLDMLLVFSDADWQGTYGLHSGTVVAFPERRHAAAFRDFAATYDQTPPARLN